MLDDNSLFERRIVRLERLNRVLVAMVVGLALFGLAAAAGPREEVQARSFELIDHDGNVRAELSVREGAVGLYLKDETGSDRLSAIHDAEGTGLFVEDETGTTRVGVAQWAHGGGGVALHGADSRGAAVLYLKGEEGSLRFFDAAGAVTSRFPPAAAEEAGE